MRLRLSPLRQRLRKQRQHLVLRLVVHHVPGRAGIRDGNLRRNELRLGVPAWVQSLRWFVHADEQRLCVRRSVPCVLASTVQRHRVLRWNKLRRELQRGLQRLQRFMRHRKRSNSLRRLMHGVSGAICKWRGNMHEFDVWHRLQHGLPRVWKLMREQLRTCYVWRHLRRSTLHCAGERDTKLQRRDLRIHVCTRLCCERSNLRYRAASPAPSNVCVCHDDSGTDVVLAERSRRHGCRCRNLHGSPVYDAGHKCEQCRQFVHALDTACRRCLLLALARTHWQQHGRLSEPRLGNHDSSA